MADHRTRQTPLQPQQAAKTRPERRSDHRVRLAGDVRLILHSPAGITTRLGQLIDVSENGCALRLYKPVAVGAVAQIDFRTKSFRLSLPAKVRWCRDDTHSFRVGC